MLHPYRFDEENSNHLLVTSDNLLEGKELLDFDDEGIYIYDLQKNEIIGSYENHTKRKIKAQLKNVFKEKKIRFLSKDDSNSLHVIATFSDTSPMEYFLYDLDKHKLSSLGKEYPRLDSAELRSMQEVNFAARDGTDIPAFLTLPKDGDGPWPLVVYPHGGPWAHDIWGFDNYVQFIASRGYAVFQPQFRGSTGYGQEHLSAGYGEWGNLIQDDITDGVNWLIEQKKVDPNKVCIMGSSFGGYAAAMGAVKTPNLYRCVISINGVYDLPKHLRDLNKLLFSDINKMINNQYGDAKNFSPYHLAEQVIAPMLIIGGEKDTVVPIEQSRKMLKRLKKYKKQVEYVELPDGEHWRTIEKNEIAKLTAIGKFLSVHLDD